MAKMSKNSNSSFSSVKGISKSAGSSIAKIAKEATEDLVIKNDDKETENINVETEELEDLTEEEYLDELKEQKKDYEEPLEEIEKEIAALESLSMDYREWRAKYKDKYDLDELREIAKEKRDTYKDDIKEYKEDLKNDKATLESAIYKIEQLEKTAKYDQLSTEEEYQDYEKSDSKESLEEIKKIDLDKLFNKQYEGNLESYCRLNDIDYDKINELEFAEYVKKHDKLAYTSYFKGEELGYLIELDDEELTKKYNYLFETKGKDAADDYLTAMKDTIHQKVGSKRAQEYLNGLEKDEDGNYDNKAIANYLDTMLKGGGSGLNSFFEGLEAWGEKDHVYTANEYESMYILSALQENESFTNFLDNTYELSSSVGNMLPSVLIGTVTSPIAGTVVMGASAGGSNYHQMKVEGESTKDAITYGVLSGLSEAAIQHYLGAIPGLNDVSVTSLKTFGKSVAKEGLEEGVQEFFDATLQADIKDEDLNIKDTIKNSLKGAIYGALTAGIFNGASFGTNKISKAGSIETDVKSDTKIEREVSEENGFQLNIDDIKGFYKAKLDQGFFTKDQVDNIISSINSKGYISEDTGEHLLDLFDGDYDVYIKTIHSSDLDSINEKGIYCNGTSTSIGGGVPQSINDINIDNTITGVDNIIDILRVIKNSNGFSQGLNPTDGTLIIKVPKGTDIKNYIYYNENENAFCISPECLDSFVKVDSDGIEQDVKDISGESVTKDMPGKQMFKSTLNYSSFTAANQVKSVLNKMMETNDDINNTVANNIDNILNSSEISSLVFNEAELFDDSFTHNNRLINELNINFNSTDELVSHELGHLLELVIGKEKIPEDFSTINNKLINKLNSNEEIVSFLENVIIYNEKMVNRSKDSAREYINNHIDEKNNYINETIKSLENVKQEADKLNIDYNTYSSLISEYDTNSIEYRNKIANLYDLKIEKEIYDMNRLNDHEFKIYDIVCGIIDSIYNGNNPFYEKYYLPNNLRSHNKEYYNSSTFKSFDEQFSDYFALRVNRDTYEGAAILLQRFLGKDWFVMMNEHYEKLALDLKRLTTKESSSNVIKDDITSNYLQNINMHIGYVFNVIKTIDYKYGSGKGLAALEKYLIDGNINHITRDNNCRSYINSLDRDTLTLCLNQIITNYNIHNSDPLPNNLTPARAKELYSVYLAKMNSSSTYYDYSYNEYMNYVNYCKSNNLKYFYNYEYLNLSKKLQSLQNQMSYSKKYMSLKTENQINQYYGSLNSKEYRQIISLIKDFSSISNRVAKYNFNDIAYENFVNFVITESNISTRKKQELQNYFNTSLQGTFLSQLNVSEALAIYEYTAGSGTILMYLTDPYKQIYPWYRIKDKNTLNNIIKGLDSAIIKYGPLENNMILYRGDTFSKLSLWKDWNVRNYYDLQNYIGKVVNCETYMSTGVSKEGSFPGEIKWIIKAPIGTKGMYINDISEYFSDKSQFEYIVKRNSKFRIDNVYKDENGVVIIKAKIVE